MIFVETPIFTAQLRELLTDDEYSEFQKFLIRQPEAGDVIRETGGLRKVRWSAGDKGKRGGVRVIYSSWMKQTSSGSCSSTRRAFRTT